METVAQPFDMILAQFPFAAQDFRHDAGRSEYVQQVLLLEAVLIHKEAQNFQRFCPRQRILLLFEILNQQRQQVRQLPFCRG